MTSIIVLFSVVFIIHELNVLLKPLPYDRKMSKIKQDFKTKYINPNHRNLIIFELLYVVWQISGLLTPYWPIFLCLICINLISNRINEKTDVERLRTMHRQIDSLFCLVLLSLIIYFHHSHIIL
jgi:hypothetical protein